MMAHSRPRHSRAPRPQPRTRRVARRTSQLGPPAPRAQAEAAYLSPELSEKAREEGNELFKQGKYPEAIEKYSDAMKRNPKSATPYSNRAACYQKLMEWQLAIKDADKCVATRNPTFLP